VTCEGFAVRSGISVTTGRESVVSAVDPDAEPKTFIAELLGAVGTRSEHPTLNINRLTPITADQNFFVILLSLHAAHDVAVSGLTHSGIANRWQRYHSNRRWGDS
jgi:hypothetical protein